MANRRVVRVTRSPMNAKRWCLELDCGHEVWVSASRKPTAKTAPCDKVRTLASDPDFRHQPKTESHCWYCQRDFKRGVDVRETFVVNGALLLHPNDVEHHAADYSDVAGWLPIGSDCAARIGLEWSRARRTANQGKG